MTIQLVDSSSSSLTVTWPAVDGAKRYVLEYRIAAAFSETDDEDFQLLSDKLTQTQVRKRNLSAEIAPDGFIFRVGAVLDDGNKSPENWVSHKHPFLLLNDEADKSRMDTPTMTPAGNHALVISWKKKTNDETVKTELQMRENKGGEIWQTIAASLGGTEVRKRNLTSKLGYQFRVRPSSGGDAPFSPPSDPVIAKGLSGAMLRWFQGLENPKTLLKSGSNRDPVPLADALGGKEFVLLYVSAHWCGPCRQFTPMLSDWYKSMGGGSPTQKSPVEVVFLSADHDENGFKQYFGSMPWLAIDYDDDAREQLMSQIRVQGIPRLVVLHAETGKIVVDNAVGQQLDIQKWRQLVK